MAVLIVTVVLVVLGAILFFTGWMALGLKTVFHIAYDYHKKARRGQRPGHIYLIRHGESQANIDKTLYVRMPDSKIGLAETGQQQALEAGKKLRAMIGDQSLYVYMSPYLRSKQTWANIKKSFEPSQILYEREDPRLREQEFGRTDDAQKLQKEFQEQKAFGEFYYRFDGGESGADVYDRASLVLDTLFRDMENGLHDSTQNIVIVTHGFFIRLLLMRYFSWSVDELDTVPKFNNCEICKLTKVGGIYTLDGKRTPPTQFQ